MRLNLPLRVHQAVSFIRRLHDRLLERLQQNIGPFEQPGRVLYRLLLATITSVLVRLAKLILSKILDERH